MVERPNILCVGRLYCDVIFTDLPRMPTAGTEVFAGGLGVHAGGGSAITAGHFSALGHHSALAAFLPTAGFGLGVMRELEALGIDLSLCRTQDDGLAPQLTAALVQNGERAFVTHRVGPALPRLNLEDIQRVRPVHIHIGEATTFVDHPELIDLANSVGATLSLDCSWDDDLDAKAITRLLPEVDVFLPNEAEVLLLRALGVPEPFCKLTVIKQGEEGATAVTNGFEIREPARPAQVVDTTGAGDAFNAAFLSAWLRDQPIKQCLHAGNVRGGETVGYGGGLGGLATKRSQPLPESTN